jgi:hypothetical protein
MYHYVRQNIKIRENPTIMKIQNPLQRGFTENSAPLLCELFTEEYERENKTSSAQVGAQQFIFPILPPSPELLSMSSSGFT